MKMFAFHCRLEITFFLISLKTLNHFLLAPWDSTNEVLTCKRFNNSLKISSGIPGKGQKTRWLEKSQRCFWILFLNSLCFHESLSLFSSHILNSLGSLIGWNCGTVLDILLTLVSLWKISNITTEHISAQTLTYPAVLMVIRAMRDSLHTPLRVGLTKNKLK